MLNTDETYVDHVTLTRFRRGPVNATRDLFESLSRDAIRYRPISHLKKTGFDLIIWHLINIYKYCEVVNIISLRVWKHCQNDLFFIFTSDE